MLHDTNKFEDGFELKGIKILNHKYGTLNRLKLKISETAYQIELFRK